MKDFRGVCVAYVTRDKVIRQNYKIGTQAFHQMYVNSPEGTHYIIAYDDNKFIVFDMWRALMEPNSVGGSFSRFLPPPEQDIKYYDDLDVAIAATVLTYNTVSNLLERHAVIRNLIRRMKEPKR